MTGLSELWETKHRGELHSPSSWASNGSVCLTYVPTCAGFSGTEQLASFSAAWPASRYPLSASQIGRFDNGITRVSCKEFGRCVVDEAVVSIFHHEAMAWFIPTAVPSMKQIQVPMAFVVEYAADEDVLQCVRVYWDQAQVSKQAKIADGTVPLCKSVAERLLKPSSCNANPCQPAQEEPQPTRLPAKKGVLDGIKTLLTDLPDAPVTPARHRKIPAFDSSAMRSELDDSNAVAPLTLTQAPCPAKISNIPFDDNVEEVKPVGLKLKDNIFCVDEHDAKPVTSMTINPKRLESHIFDDPSPYKPAIALDQQRFKSNISFGEEPAQGPCVRITPKQSHLQSHIFDPASSPITHVQAKVRPGIESHFSLAADDEGSAPIAPSVKLSDRNCAGHLIGSGLCPQETEEAPNPAAPRSCNRNNDHFEGTSFQVQEQPQPNAQSYPRNNYNQSHIAFTDQDETPSNCPVSTKSSAYAATYRNQSQVCFDDEAPLPKVVPSSRITQPPGGQSQISFF